jgi:hypothetical protein
VRGTVIELKEEVVLSEGAEVEVVIKERRGEEPTPGGDSKGSPQAVLAALDAPPRCTPADIDALLQAIEEGKRPVQFKRVFDPEDKEP